MFFYGHSVCLAITEKLITRRALLFILYLRYRAERDVVISTSVRLSVRHIMVLCLNEIS